MSKHLDIVWTNQFKKDYKLAMKRHLDIDLLDNIIRKLASNEELPEKNKDHALTGNWIGHRECHIQPDWLLVYKIVQKICIPATDACQKENIEAMSQLILDEVNVKELENDLLVLTLT